MSGYSLMGGSRLNHRLVIFSFILLLLLVPIPAQTLWWREFVNSGHSLGFAVIACLLFFTLQDRLPDAKQSTLYLWTVSGGMLFGVLVELTQGYVGREAEWADLFVDFCGLISGVGFIHLLAVVEGRAQRIKQSLISFVVISVSMLVANYPLLLLTSHLLQRQMAFPQLTQFDKRWSSSYVRFNNAEIIDVLAEGEIFRIQFGVGQYPGFNLIETEPDWRRYSALHFDVVSHNLQNVNIVVRIDDQMHDQRYADRFNQSIVIKPGLNEIELPLDQVSQGPDDRQLDMSAIASLIVFMHNVEKEISLDFSNIYLN